MCIDFEMLEVNVPSTLFGTDKAKLKETIVCLPEADCASYPHRIYPRETSVPPGLQR